MKQTKAIAPDRRPLSAFSFIEIRYTIETRAALHRWSLNLDNGMATPDPSRSRQIIPRGNALKVSPLATAIAQLIRERNNPIHPPDKTKRYRVDVPFVESCLERLVDADGRPAGRSAGRSTADAGTASGRESFERCGVNPSSSYRRRWASVTIGRAGAAVVVVIVAYSSKSGRLLPTLLQRLSGAGV